MNELVDLLYAEMVSKYSFAAIEKRMVADFIERFDSVDADRCFDWIMIQNPDIEVEL